jgi:GR25 family glycosyltransferase involved in LPS biosynthesis
MYEYFDDIVCINLDISKERRQYASVMFKKLNIPARFFTAHKHPKGGRYGCFDSHIQIIRHAYNSGYNNVLVFEDDFMPTPAYSTKLVKQSIDFMKSNTDWDIFYYGYGSVKIDNKTNKISHILEAKLYVDNIVQFNPYSTHSICYSRRAMKKILENYEKYIHHLHIDVLIGSYLDLKNYCIVPMLFDQIYADDYNVEPSNISETFNRKILYPIFGFSKLNYVISCMKHYYNIFYGDFKNLIYSQNIFFIILCCSLLIILFALYH